jgi:hypothetical protein
MLFYLKKGELSVNQSRSLICLGMFSRKYTKIFSLITKPKHYCSINEASLHMQKSTFLRLTFFYIVYKVSFSISHKTCSISIYKSSSKHTNPLYIKMQHFFMFSTWYIYLPLDFQVRV